MSHSHLRSFFLLIFALCSLNSLKCLSLREPLPALSTLRERNEKVLHSLKVKNEIASRILDDPRMSDIELSLRIQELREAAGMTRSSLKQYLYSYPDVCIGLFADKVKTAKSVLMRVLKLTEQEYAAGVKRISLQTNNKMGTLFRGNFPFIVASLREMAGFQQQDLTFLFNNYPTIFTLDYRTVANHLEFLRYTVGYSQEQLRLLLLRNCRSALCGQERALALMSFFETELSTSSQEFCELTVAHPRLFGVSLQNTLIPKMNHMLDETSWGLSRDRLSDLIQRAPSILTTPATTTQQLWDYLHLQLHLSKDDCQDIVRKYPNLLRVNVKSLGPKLCSLALAELALLAKQHSLALCEPTKSPAADTTFQKIAQQLYSQVAAALLKRAPVALTCSLDRIEARMGAFGAHEGLTAATAALKVGDKRGIEVGPLALSFLLGANLEVLKVLSSKWNEVADRDNDFPVPPFAVTISASKFDAMLAASKLSEDDDSSEEGQVIGSQKKKRRREGRSGRS